MSTDFQNPRASARGAVKQAKSTGDAELRSAGWDLHDAAGALLASTKDKT